MKKTLLQGSIAFLGLLFFSCSGGGTKSGSDSTATPAKSNAIAPLDSMAQHFPHGGGQPVAGDHIQGCVDAYNQTMSTYGITTDSPSVPIKKCPAMTYRTTQIEGLTYATFRTWLDSVVAVIDPVGKGSNVWLKIQPGITTEQFASAYGLPPSRIGRITYFIVPALIDSTKAQSNGPGSGGYDVGGLQP